MLCSVTAAHAQMEDSHAQICGTAERFFVHIRDSVSAAAVPAAKSALLGPLGQELACQLSLQLFGTSDAAFMRMFTGRCCACTFALRSQQGSSSARARSLLSKLPASRLRVHACSL